MGLRVSVAVPSAADAAVLLVDGQVDIRDLLRESNAMILRTPGCRKRSQNQENVPHACNNATKSCTDDDNFDGLVKAGEMLVVLGRPGSYAYA